VPLAAAEAACSRATTLTPRGLMALLTAAELHRQLAEWATQPGRRASEAALALKAIDAALAVDGELAEAYALAGQVHVLQIHDGKGAERRAAAQRAVQSFERAFQINPTLKRSNEPALAEAQAALHSP
jgi:hypothetical protein